jgi:hypothetical protein
MNLTANPLAARRASAVELLRLPFFRLEAVLPMGRAWLRACYFVTDP